MKRLYIIILTLVTTMFNLISASENPEKRLHSILKAFEEHQLRLGYKMDMKGFICPVKYEQFIFSFNSTKEMSLDSARTDLIKSVENLLTDLNSEASIKELMDKTPLQPENICIYLYYNDKYDNPIQAPYISSAWVHKDKKIHYESLNSKSGEKTQTEEPYEEAYQKVFGNPRAGK